MTAICDADRGTVDALCGALVDLVDVTDGPARGLVGMTSLEDLRRHLEADPAEDVVVLGPSVDRGTALRVVEATRIHRPGLRVILVRERLDEHLVGEALRAGIRAVVDRGDLAGLRAAVDGSGPEPGPADHQPAPDHRPAPEPVEPAGPGGRIVTVFSAKGGCGKTTLATNLAAVLADQGRHQVCLVDLDLAFGDVAIALQLFPTHTIADAVRLGDQVDFAGLSGLLTPHSPGLTTLVAPVDPGRADSIPAVLVSRLLQVLRHHFDYVVVDTPPAFDDQVLAAFDLSDVVALIATLDLPALKNLTVTLETMRLLSYPRERWRIVLNRADSQVGLAAAEVEETLRMPIAVQIPSSRDVPAAINRGVPIVLDDPHHPVSQAIRAFAQQYVVASATGPAVLLGPTIDPAPEPVRAERRGFLRRRSRA